MGQIYILLAIFLWSSLGVVIKRADIPVHILIFYALMVSGILQGIFILGKGYHHEICDLSRIKYPALLGVVSAVNMVTYYYALKTTTIANAVLTHYTAPVIVAFLAAAFLKEKMTWSLSMSIMLASAGLWVTLNGLSPGEGQIAGIIAGLISGGAYAVIVILGRLFAQKYRPVMLTFLVNATIIILLAPFIREFPQRALGSILFTGVVHSTLAPVLYYRGLRDVSAGRTAVLGYLEPLCAVVLGIFVLHELPGIRVWFGGMLIILSGYLTLRTAHPEAA
jgi:drug/metabolite transporter (DMT)-like permease